MLVIQCLVLLLLLLNGGDAWRRRRRRRCISRDCEVSQWSHWSGCSQRCGVIETQYRTRYKTSNEACGGSCYYDLRVQRNCDMICNNGGTPSYSQCSCRTGFWGRCCERDRNECYINPKYCLPGGTCINTHGSYRCICGNGYVASKSLTACIADRRGCQVNDCSPGGTCVNTANGRHRCICENGYVASKSLTACIADRRRCQINDCSPGGTCVNTTNGSRRCICGNGYVASKSLTACIAESNKESTKHIGIGVMFGVVLGSIGGILVAFLTIKVMICICCSSDNQVDFWR